MKWIFIFNLIFSDESEEVVPTMNDNIIPRRPIVPAITPNSKNGHANPSATYKPKTAAPSHNTPAQTTTGRTTSTTNSAHNIIQAAHPQDNEIAGSVNIK